VLEWAPVGAITHNIAVGDLVLLTDLIDLAYGRQKTYFEHSPLGALRQFPLFCPTVRRAAGHVLHEMKLVYHGGATATVTEGPRMATPAEIRFQGHFHVDLITHAFVPEVFLAKELQLCYAGIGYVANYAETGSTHRPFAGRDLFGGQTHRTEADRLAAAGGAMKEILHRIAAALAQGEGECHCDSTMAENVKEFGLSADWRAWFE
jgi:5'-methylthioadenosine phosphorylase